MSSLQKKRNDTISFLSEKFSQSTSKKYESEIYDMCVRIENDYEEELEDVYTEYAYQYTGLMMVSENIQDIIRDIKEDKDIRESSGFGKFKRKKDSVITDIVSDGNIKIEAGVFECRNKKKKCHGTYNTINWSLQTRSADEPATIFVKCMSCKVQYRMG